MAERNSAARRQELPRDEDLGARKRPGGGPETDFGRETGGSDYRGTPSGVVGGVLANPSQAGLTGSGPVNTGPGTEGGSASVNTTGAADLTGDVSSTTGGGRANSSWAAEFGWDRRIFRREDPGMPGGDTPSGDGE